MTLKVKIAQVFVIIVIVALCLILAAGVWRGKSRPVQQETQQECPLEAEMKLTDMEFTEMQEGKRFWTLCATEAKYFQDQQKTLLQAVRLTFYLEKNGEEIHVTSREGILYAGTKDIELRGDVHAMLPREYVMTTETAHYINSTRTVESTDPIHISGPGLELDGIGWKYKITDHLANVGGKIRASLVLGNLRIED